MATSAVGPGFITQTTVFTEQLRTSFGFVILCSMVLDIVVQLNVWRIVSVSGLHAQDLANKVLKGSGHLLTVLIVAGGLAFNIGNIGGAALGLNVMFGLELWAAGLISACVALIIFWYREVGKAMDLFARLMGIVMIVLTGWIAVKSNPPLGGALIHTFAPEIIDLTAIMVLVGGTVGGYISFSGIHRLVDAGVVGAANLRNVSKSSVRAIVVATSMRILLFLAALGVVAGGGVLDPGNPPASVFQVAAGPIGYKVFGLVLWCAALTSVVGSAYTSVSFMRSATLSSLTARRIVITLFIVSSTAAFVFVGRPVAVLILVGALNGVILPIALALMLFAARRTSLIGDYRHPKWIEYPGWLVLVLLVALSIQAMTHGLATLWDQ